jgi:hypothetical protein
MKRITSLFMYILISGFIFGKEYLVDNMFSFVYPEEKVDVYDLRNGEPQRSKDKMILYLKIINIDKIAEPLAR